MINLIFFYSNLPVAASENSVLKSQLHDNENAGDSFSEISGFHCT